MQPLQAHRWEGAAVAFLFLPQLQTPSSSLPQPIVMRAEFAYAPNLTIVDTPGFILKACSWPTRLSLLYLFACCLPALLPVAWLATNAYIDPTCLLILQARKGEADTTPDDIMAMVKAQCA